MRKKLTRSSGKTRLGRPPRKEKMNKLNLLVATSAKRRAFALASRRDISVGRLFENLVIAEEARMAEVAP
jgi:predicted HicB family RNase H-like nuclease